MLKSRTISRIAGTYFDPGLDLRVQAFNLLAFAGIAAGIVVAFISFITGTSVNIVINLSTSVFAFILVHLARKKNCYGYCYRLTVIAVFIIAFPFMFFTAGGYHSGMPCFFVFAIVYTALMLTGRDRTIAIAAEFTIYTSVCLIACFRPYTVTFFATETDLLIDNVAAVIVSGTLLLLVILLYIRIYNNRQKQFEALGRLKTEFLQDISHEMQNPLTTITAGIDYANSCMSKPNGAIDAHNTLKIVQDEAMRLGRMVSGMVRLVAMSGNAESREKVNFAVMLNSCADMFRHILEKKGNMLHVDVAPDLPYVYCVADRITQVLINLLSNAAKYTKDGHVSILASHDAAFITIRVRNSGDGIPPELLSQVFNRGVSGNESSGLGLTICKTIVEAHGGVINIESEPDKGTEVTFTIPVYGGQSEVRGYE